MNFELSNLPSLIFGAGEIQQLPLIIKKFGNHILLVTGGSSWSRASWWQPILKLLSTQDIRFSHITVDNEPSPELVDNVVKDYAKKGIDSVVAIGGGSAMDAAKAIAGLLPGGHSVMDYLEGVGPELQYHGPSLPFIAVPTTAGTGSEATKNAVLSRQGANGFKKSFRDEALMARVAIIDPDLLTSCPKGVIAANGMDALTQLIESYVSIKQNLFCNTLGEAAIRRARKGLLPLYETKAGNAQARTDMAFASLVSGINLAQTGLGSVHGLASPLGAYYPIPHGVACGSLLAEATQMNINAMLEREPDNQSLESYKKIAQMLCGVHFSDQQTAFNALMKTLNSWTDKLSIPRLSEYGVKEDDIRRIVKNVSPSSMKTNPIVLTEDEIAAIVRARI